MKEVAHVLGISTRTAETHKYQLMQNVGVRTVPELIQYGLNTGLLTLPGASTASRNPFSRT
jgi:DNA-binding CsgD family transcriptional regulator